MRYIRKLISIVVLFPLFLLSAGQIASADEALSPGKKHVVIQVSTNDAQTQTIALNNAVNLQKLFGLDNIDIEIVAYGPGLGFLTQSSKQADRIKSLAMQDIRFSACGNTMEKIAKKTGKEPKLIEGVQVVTAGVSRIMELQEQGYAYIRP